MKPEVADCRPLTKSENEKNQSMEMKKSQKLHFIDGLLESKQANKCMVAHGLIAKPKTTTK